MRVKYQQEIILYHIYLRIKDEAYWIVEKRSFILLKARTSIIASASKILAMSFSMYVRIKIFAKNSFSILLSN